MFDIIAETRLDVFIAEHGLDIFTTLLGLIYIWLEYRAHIALWLVSVVMPALDIILYWQHGLYGDAAMAVYYTLAAVYGYVMWRYGTRLKTLFRGETATSASSVQTPTSSTNVDEEVPAATSHQLPITSMPRKKYPLVVAFFFVAWVLTYLVLANFTNSTVPLLDAFTNALSFVGLWALAKKYIEQWMFWIVVDVVCCYLYIIKGIPFKALLYGLYVAIAMAGYFKWKRMMK